MAKKKQQPEKRPSGGERSLKTEAKRLRAQLAAAEKSAEKWKGKARDHRSVAAGAKAELAAVRRRLAKAEASVTKWKGRATKPALTVVPPTAPSDSPDDTWNVTRLRAEARSRGVAGYSRKTKEQLLDELSR